MLGAWRRRRLRAKAAELGPSEEEWHALIRAWPCLERVDPARRSQLANRTGEILATHAFCGAGGLEPDRADCLPVAALAAQVVLALGPGALSGFRTFILYRDAFEVDLEETDDDGLVHRGRDLRAGEAWHGGPIVLSLADVAESGQGDGYHVVAHEIAHQIDGLNGEPDGYPPLPREIDPEQWSACLGAAHADLLADLESDREPWIDPYAAESPAEFFAVCTEFLFDQPQTLATRQRELFNLLSTYYRQYRPD